MRLSTYYSKMNTNAFHNLCTTTAPPPNIGNLLSLGLKYCIKTPYPKKNSLTDAFTRFRRDIRLRYFFEDNEEDNNPLDPFNPSLYIKSD